MFRWFLRVGSASLPLALQTDVIYESPESPVGGNGIGGCLRVARWCHFHPNWNNRIFTNAHAQEYSFAPRRACRYTYLHGRHKNRFTANANHISGICAHASQDAATWKGEHAHKVMRLRHLPCINYLSTWRVISDEGWTLAKYTNAVFLWSVAHSHKVIQQAALRSAWPQTQLLDSTTGQSKLCKNCC